MPGDATLPDRDVAPFWRSRGGRLLIQACGGCGEPFHYPRVLCPFCMSRDVRWTESAGEGRVYSVSVTRQGEPYVMAIVELAEGPRLLTNIVGCSPDDVSIEQDVVVTFRTVDGVDTPFFTPRARSDARDASAEEE